MKVRNLLFSPALLAITLLIAACGGGGPTTPDTFTLNVNKTGAGTVTSVPAGINCGEDCSEDFSRGVTVTLTAQAADGSVFGGFTGDCTGTSCTVTMDAAKTVTANFSPEDPDLTDPGDGFDLERSINMSNHDAEEFATGIDIGSSDLELVYNADPAGNPRRTQTVGLTF